MTFPSLLRPGGGHVTNSDQWNVSSRYVSFPKQSVCWVEGGCVHAHAFFYTFILCTVCWLHEAMCHVGAIFLSYSIGGATMPESLLREATPPRTTALEFESFFAVLKH